MLAAFVLGSVIFVSSLHSVQARGHEQLTHTKTDRKLERRETTGAVHRCIVCRLELRKLPDKDLLTTLSFTESILQVAEASNIMFV